MSCRIVVCMQLENCEKDKRTALKQCTGMSAGPGCLMHTAQKENNDWTDRQTDRQTDGWGNMYKVLLLLTLYLYQSVLSAHCEHLTVSLYD